MLAEIQRQADYDNVQMEQLKAAGKEKTATYRQYFANRMMYRAMLDIYRRYRLME